MELQQLQQLNLVYRKDVKMAEITYTPEHAKKVALARLDLVKQWEEFRRKSNVKLQLIMILSKCTILKKVICSIF